MKNISPWVTALLASFLHLSLSAQNVLDHEKKIYTDTADKVFVNMDVPLYLSISANSDGSNGTVLKGQEPKYSYPMYLDTEGYNTFRSPSKVDPETGKIVYPKEDVIFELYADGTAPSIKINYGGENRIEVDGTAVINGNQVSFEANDNLAGVSEINYSLGQAAYQKYSQPIKLTEDKVYTIRYYAVDNVGNVGEPSTVKVRPDTKPPVTSIAIDGDQSDNTLSQRTTIALEANDNIAGLSKIFWSIDDGRTYTYGQPIRLSALSEGEHTLTYFATDKVDNNEEKKTFTFFLDKSAPRVISEVVGNTFIANGKEYFSGRTKLKLVALDNKAGVKEILYSVNGGQYTLYEEPFYVKQAGNLDIDVLAIDNVNNRQTIEEISGNSKNRSYVDLSGPNLSHSFSGPSFVINDTTYLNGTSRINLRGTDGESGFKEIDWQLNGGSLETYDGPISIVGEGFYNITYNGYDNLQNSNTSNALVYIDNTGPDVYNRFSIESKKMMEKDGEKLNVYPPHVVLFLSATDKHAGLDNITYKVNGSGDLAYRGLIQDFKKDTQYTIEVNVTDKLGNENSEEIKFFIE